MGIQSTEVLLKVKALFEGKGLKDAGSGVGGLTDNLKKAKTASTEAAGAIDKTAKEIDDLKRAAREAAAGVHGLNQQDFAKLLASGRQVTGVFQNLRSSIIGGLTGALTALAGVSFGSAIQQGVNSAKAFEQNMAQVKLLTSATSQEVDNFRKTVGQMAKETLTSTDQLAKGFFVVQSAGVQGAEALEFTKTAAEAAAIGLGDVDDVVRAASTAFANFKDQGLTSSQAIVGIAAAAKVGNFEVSELAGSLNRVLPAAKAAGANFNDVGAGIANISISTGNATQSVENLNALLVRFNQYSPQTDKILTKMGTSLEQVKQNIRDRGLLEALHELDEQFKTTFGRRADTFIAAAFQDQNAVAGFHQLADNFAENSKRVQQYADATKTSVHDMLEEFKRTDAGKVAQAQAELASQLTKLGADILPVLSQALTFVTAHFEDLKAIVVGVGAALTVGGIAAGVAALISTLPSLAAALALVTDGMIAFDIAADANPIGGLVVIIGALIGVLGYLAAKFPLARTGLELLIDGFKLLFAAVKLSFDVTVDFLHLMTNGDWSFSRTKAGLKGLQDQYDENAKHAQHLYNVLHHLPDALPAKPTASAGTLAFQDDLAAAIAGASNVGPGVTPKHTTVPTGGITPEDVLGGSHNKKNKKPKEPNATKLYDDAVKGAERYLASLRSQQLQLQRTREEQAIFDAEIESMAAVAAGATKETYELSKSISDAGKAQAFAISLHDMTEALKGYTDSIKSAPEFTLLDDAVFKTEALQTKMEALRDSTIRSADLMAGAFGRVGTAIGGIAVANANAKAEIAKINADLAKFANENKNDQKKVDEETARAAEKRRAVEVNANIEALDSFKQLFSEKSKAYKVLNGLEAAYQALQIAGSIKAIAIDAVHTAQSVANAFTRGAADAAAGAAKIFSELGPFGFPVVAAMVAVLAGLGLKLAGGGGHGPHVPTAQERQQAAGTGSVLGDATAKSDSIDKSLAEAAKLQNKDLEYSLSMVRSLKSIDQNIGSLAAALSQQLQVGGAFDTSGLGLGTQRGVDTGGLLLGTGVLGFALSKVPVIGGILKSLFGTKKTTSVSDFGLDLNGGALGDLISGGVTGNTFQDIITQTKKKFFGLTYSNKTKTSTQTGALDSDLTGQITLILQSLRQGVLEAASSLGVEGADKVLDSFQVEIGKISFKDLTGEEIEKQLNAIFSKLGDDLAEAVLPSITQFQKAGEGAMETLTRVARDVAVVDVTFQSIGKTFGLVGLDSIAARERLVGFFGTIDDLVDGVSQFAEDFLTDQERLAPIQKAVSDEMERLGYSSIKTKDDFKKLVLSIDTTTEAGAQLFASLIAVAPAFAKVADAAQALSDQALQDAITAVKDASDSVVDSYRDQADELTATITKMTQFGQTVRTFRQTLETGDLAGNSPEDQYLKTKALFEQTKAAALGGDEEAQKNFQSVFETFLKASRDYYASSAPYFADLAEVKKATDQLSGFADSQVDYAQAQLKSLNDLLDGVDGVIDGIAHLGETTLSMKDGVFQVASSVNSLTAAIQTLIAALQAKANLTGGVTGSTFVPNPNDPSKPYISPDQLLAGGVDQARAQSYLDRYPDVAAYYAQHPELAQAGLSLLDFAQYHAVNQGQFEDRTFAGGGEFMVGGVGGTDSQRVSFRASPKETVTVRTAAQMAMAEEQERLLAQLLEAIRAGNNQRGLAADATLERLGNLEVQFNGLKRALERAPERAK